MAARQTIEKHEDSILLQRGANGNKTNADDPRRPSSSIKSFQKITRKVMSRSSVGAHQVAHSHSQKSTNGTSKDCRNLFTPPVVSCPSCDDGSRPLSHQTVSNTNRMAANDGNTQQFVSQNKAMDCKSLQTARSAHPASSEDSAADASFSDHRFVSKHDSSTQFKLSNTKVSHRSLSENLQTIAVPEENPIAVPHTSIKCTKQSRIEVASKHRKQNELCKDCKTSVMASVCFINNDGRIAAALTHPSHYCKKPGCAANRGRFPSASTMSKNASVLNKQVPRMHSQPTKNTSLNYAKDVGDGSSVRLSTASSTQGSDRDSKHQEVIKIKETCMSAAAKSLQSDHESQLMTNTDMDPHNVSSHHRIGVHESSPCRDRDVLDGFSQSENLQCLISRRVRENHGEDSTSIESSSATTSLLVSDVIRDHDGVVERGSVETDAAVELQHHFKSPCYHGDNEYSCSEDGTDVTTTPNSLIKGAFDENASSCHEEEHVEDKVSEQSSRSSSMARMRRRYLETLRDQQEAERVRLRKQEIMARKQAGDWMLDCHMEELLHRLAPNGEARVKVLVEAFETVINHSDSESSEMHHEEHDQLHDGQEEQHGKVHTDPSS